VFKITTGGALTTIHSFGSSDDGSTPAGTLVQSNGNFYGITQGYGSNASQKGTVYQLTESGALTTLYHFCSQTNCADGAYPSSGGLIQSSDGTLYGATEQGGDNSTCLATQPYGCGTVFRLTTAGTLTTLHTFAGYPNDGNTPYDQLVQAADGNVYGTTQLGGANNAGTIFRMSPGGTLTTIYSFCTQTHQGQCVGGAYPGGGLVQATDGYLYGGTSSGGYFGYGTLFRINRQATLLTLHNFDSSDGASPGSDLTQGTNGSLYGDTQGGGSLGVGTVFRLDMGLGPFVKTLTTFGKTGQTVQILGQGLTGSTSVTFNGVPATSLSVVSDTYMTAVVPSGATTGPVVVTTPSGPLTSNVNFRISQ
jgi:uncharacterized repeat protein (TIGR03803 family)